MSAVAVKLLEKCTAQGISLRPGEGFKLKVSPPPERLPKELCEELKRHKAEILSLLNSQETSLNGRSLYQQAAEEVREDCFAIDGIWLIDQHPTLWERMVTLDDEMNRMEHEGVAEPHYREVLECLVSAVKEARTLYESEQSQIVEVKQ